MTKHPTDDDRHEDEFADRIRGGLYKNEKIISEYQLQEIADAAAAKAIRSMWIQFGVDLNDAESVRSINLDFIEMRRGRLAKTHWEGLWKGSIASGIIGAIGFFGAHLYTLFFGHK